MMRSAVSRVGLKTVAEFAKFRLVGFLAFSTKARAVLWVQLNQGIAALYTPLTPNMDWYHRAHFICNRVCFNIAALL
jgi:hypothetical protein